jgi:hypothetical protein
MTMQSLLSPTADMPPHWVWAAMCHKRHQPAYSITSSARAIGGTFEPECLGGLEMRPLAPTTIWTGGASLLEPPSD